MENNQKKYQRIGIDARFYGPLGKGLGRYVQELVDNIIQLNRDSDYEFEYVVFLGPDNFNEFKNNDPHVHKKLVTLPWYSWREQLFFPFILQREKLDLVHFPHFNVPLFTPIPFVVTIHDLILTRFPSRRASMLPAAFYWFKQLVYRLVIKVAVQRARMIIAVSKFTRQDIIKQFKAKPEKVIVTYEGVANLMKQSESSVVVSDSGIVQQKYKISSPFILYVGNAYPHKNLERLLIVFKRLRQRYSDLSLVIVGKDDYFYERLKKSAQNLSLWSQDGKGGVANSVIFPGYVPDADLATLYKQALFYVFPSFYEGFGLPPLEAMTYSCPVASSNQASLPEIIGEAAMYFNPYDEQEMLDKLSDFVENEQLRQDLVSKGEKRILNFTWLKCAQETLDIYRKILNK